MTPLEFLNLLWKEKPADLYILIWTLQSKRSHWFREVGTAAKFVATDSSDIYVGVGLADCDYGPHKRCPSDKVAGITGFWADFDLGSEAHSNKPLPATIEEALSLIPADLPPTIIVITGNGVHVWWLFNKPWIFANDDERKDAAALSFRFQTLHRGLSNQRGWAFERLADLARVLRIPGTINAKDPTKSKPVEVYSVEGRRYDPSDFLQYLDDLSIPGEEAEERAATEIAERFADQQLVINQDATIPNEMLARWMKQDLRFRNTWNRQRHDLNDQSQSGYDMALASFGVKAGLSYQQVVNLIIHHRRIHGKQQCMRMDYFRRTISKAMKTTEDASLFVPPQDESPFPSPALRSVVPSDNSGPQPNDETDERRKARLCDELSRIFGIRILRLLKISGKDPMYLMELEQGRIEIPSVGKLMSQQFIKLQFAAKLGRVIPKFKPKPWEQLVQMMLDACLVEESSDELQFEGLARIQIARYLSEDPPLTSLEGESISNQSRPLIHDDKITIRASHLQLYINKTYLQNLSVIAVASKIKAIGGKSVRVRESTFMDQDRWALPVPLFDPKDYSKHYREDCVNGE